MAQKQWIGSKIIHKEVTDSTNTDAARMSEDLPHGAVITADMQTAGKGRRGRLWISRAYENLYFSLLLKPEFAPDKASMLTLVMALAAARGIELVYGDIQPGQVQIKWPNDIVINGKKVCGILTEMQVVAGRIKHVIIGVGVNVHQQDFSEDELVHASSLDLELSHIPWKSVKHPAEREIRMELMHAILAQFEVYYGRFCVSENLKPLQELYENRLVNLGREVQVLDPGGSFTGVALGIDEQGQLVVQRTDGSRTKVYAGEVSVRGLYGYV